MKLLTVEKIGPGEPNITQGFFLDFVFIDLDIDSFETSGKSYSFSAYGDSCKTSIIFRFYKLLRFINQSFENFKSFYFPITTHTT